MEIQDNRRQRLGRMWQHGDSIDVRPDSDAGQLHSCVANGELYCDRDMALLAEVLLGADITNVFSPKTFLCHNRRIMTSLNVPTNRSTSRTEAGTL